MSGLFSTPKVPKAPTPPPVEATESDQEKDLKAKEEQRRRRAGLGRTLLTQNEPNETTAKKKLGQ